MVNFESTSSVALVTLWCMLLVVLLISIKSSNYLTVMKWKVCNLENVVFHEFGVTGYKFFKKYMT